MLKPQNNNFELSAKAVTILDDFIPDFYRTITINHSTVADALRDDIPHWCARDPVLINAPPGTGKTSLVYQQLIPYALSRGKNVLLLSNRIALSCQQKRAIMEITESPLRGRLTDQGIIEQTDFGNVRILTYHQLRSFLNDPANKEWIDNLLFVVCDEAHFFVADSTFNQYCGFCLRTITSCFHHAIRIYLSATCWDIMYPLAEAEKRNYLNLKPRYSWEPEREFLHYQLLPNFSQYDLFFFHDLDELRPKIKDDTTSKWLIFVDSKEKGKEFQKSLGSSAAYIDADSKDSAVRNAIVRDEMFSQQVLVATSVLDCGVNIKDDALTNVVVMADNRTSLIQMLGRKRCSGKEHVSLWVHIPSQKSLVARRTQIQSYLDWWCKFDNCSSESQRQALASNIWYHDDPILRKLFYMDHGHLRPNKIAVFAFAKKLYFLERITDEEDFKAEVSKWLGISEPTASIDFSGLDSFYEEHLGKPFGEDTFSDLRSIIMKLYLGSGRKEKQPKRIHDLKHNALNDRLNAMNSRYQIDYREKTWQLIVVNNPDISASS